MCSGTVFLGNGHGVCPKPSTCSPKAGWIWQKPESWNPDGPLQNRHHCCQGSLRLWSSDSGSQTGPDVEVGVRARQDKIAIHKVLSLMVDSETQTWLQIGITWGALENPSVQAAPRQMTSESQGGRLRNFSSSKRDWDVQQGCTPPGIVQSAFPV